MRFEQGNLQSGEGNVKKQTKILFLPTTRGHKKYLHQMEQEFYKRGGKFFLKNLSSQMEATHPRPRTLTRCDGSVVEYEGP